MSYFEAGTASDVNDMLGKLRTALAGNGYTLVTNDKAGNTGGQFAQLAKNGMVVNLRTGFNNEIPVAKPEERSTRWTGNNTWSWNYYWGTTVNGAYTNVYWNPSWIAMNVSTGVDGGASWHNQPGAPGSTEKKGIAVMALAAGAISRYWIFINENPDTVLLIMEVYPNKFERLAFGRLILNQEIQAGGEWFEGSRPIFHHFNGPVFPFHGSLDASNNQWGNDGHAFGRLVDSRWTIADQLDGWHHGTFTSGMANSYGPNNYWSLLGIPQPDDNNSNPESSGFNSAVNQSYLRNEGRSILHPIAFWKQMNGGGYTLIGHVGHIALCSMESVLAGEALAGVGETYMAFPGHSRLSPWNNFRYSANTSVPADEVYNFYGAGIAVRKP